MNHGKTILSQLLDCLHHQVLHRANLMFPTQKETSAMSYYDHFVAMVFAQLAHRESLRDIEFCFAIKRNSLYHCGVRGNVTRSNLAYANEHRPFEFFAQIAKHLTHTAQSLYSDIKSPLQLEGDLFAIDASIIDLGSALFPWALWQGTQSAVKLNVVCRVEEELPVFCTIVPADKHDLNFMKDIVFRGNSYYVFNKGYTDIEEWNRITQAKAYFVTRLRCGVKFRVLESHVVAKTAGLRCDQTIKLKSQGARKAYPDLLRRIRYFDAATKKSLVFVTNNFTLPGLTVAEIYKRRREIELFFRRLKQHLRIRKFYSNNENGVKIQIWTAPCSRLLAAIAKKVCELPQSLYSLLQIFSVVPFSKVLIGEAFTKSEEEAFDSESPNQSTLNI
jgi:hypothetical protein